jgi:hypothetical protein
MKPGHKKMTEKSPMYIYATEMVSNYYKYLDLEGKKLLSIVGSGDQILNAYFYGARKVIGFDINERAEFILHLKCSALRNLSYKEFIKFFGADFNSGNLSHVLYNKLRNDLPAKTRNFFDKIYNAFGNNGKRLIKSEYFRQRTMINSPASRINDYLKNEKNYLKCRAILSNKKIHFIKLDVNDILISKRLKGRFDIINLSNVLNYLTGNTDEKTIQGVLNIITRKISRKLSKTGLFFYYSYSPNLYKDWQRNEPPASQPIIIKKIKEANNFILFTKKISGVTPGFVDRINIFKCG